ncbi:MAG: IS1634 family transposase [Pseudomonadota bacterium]|nr:IS1634 family transposase [Pseudomonadota bacterium]
MFVSRVRHKNKKNGKEYQTFKLLESVRTDRGPRQRMVLNLGVDFSLPEELWKDLANRIEEIISGQQPLFSYSKQVETLAEAYARRIIAYHGKTTADRPDPDYHCVDIGTIDNELPRSVGAEHVVLETIKALGLDELLVRLGFNKPARDAALGVIVAKLVAPSSERATHIWLQTMSAVDELLGADFSVISQDRVYRVADMLLQHKQAIEEHLRLKESNLFNLEEKILLYDLTNTFFEGSGKYNRKAHFGLSKEKRSDCPLVTLGLVMDADGFPKRSDVFDGNVSEPGTLEKMIAALSFPGMTSKPLIVMDAGLATADNILWLKAQGYEYIVVSRKKVREAPAEMVTVREDKRRLIRAALVPGVDEVALYCYSTDKQVKEEGIRNRFEKRFESSLEKVRDALVKKHGTKRYDKVLEKIGRLKERFRRVARRYEISIQKDEDSGLATAISWVRKEQPSLPGVYCLRSNRLDFKEQEMFDIFTMLTDIEDTFRSMKSELGLRPIYHQNEHRCDGHLFITVLAYHIAHAIRFQLRKRGIADHWATIRKVLSSHIRISTTMKREDGKVIHVRKSSKPELAHRVIYDALHLSHRPGQTIKTII